MKFRDLHNGALFAYYPEPTRWVTALKVEKVAFLLKSGEQVEVHANKNVEVIKPLTGANYRLAVTRENEVVIISQAGEGRVYMQNVLILGHCIADSREVAPLKDKTAQKEHDEAVDIILERLVKTVSKTENLLTTLKDLITPDLS